MASMVVFAEEAMVLFEVHAWNASVIVFPSKADSLSIV